ncbi:MAG: hypothetical protein FJ095_11170 [Deltaproteobacteria bacterium]|nr:hypothetical protein [Deltaproteobacteria bacterium]
MRRLGILFVLLACEASVASAAPPESGAFGAKGRKIFSPYEEQTIARALERHRVELEPSPEGKRIEDIHIEVLEVIEARDPAPEFLNALHRTTRDSAVRRELLFREGQRFERSLIDETERNLRSLRQHSLVVIVPLRAKGADAVRLLVLVKDVWSLRLNSSFRLTGQGLEQLLLQPSEENLFGMRRTLSSTVTYDPATVSIGATYVEPRLMDSRIQFGVTAGVTINHETGQAEGTSGAFEYGVPIYSTRQRWAWGTSLSWRDAITRRFRGVALNVFNGDSATDPTNDCPNPGRCIPIRYESDVINGTVGVTRSFWGQHIQLVQLGATGDRRAFHVDDLERYDADVAARFVAERLPRSVTRNGFFARYQIYENRWAKLQEVETLGLQENYRLGLEAHARVYPLLGVLGSTTSLIGYAGSASYTHELGDGLVRVYGAGGVEMTPDHATVVNATVQGGMRLVTPRFKLGRLISDGTFTLRPENQLNALSSLGGDGRLRGYLSGSLLGRNLVAANLEFRSRALQLSTIMLGGALFYDIGDAFDAASEFRPKQGAGFGLRLGFPQLDRTVMRIDLGFSLTPTSGERSWLDGLVITFDQAFEMPQVTSTGVVR